MELPDFEEMATEMQEYAAKHGFDRMVVAAWIEGRRHGIAVGRKEAFDAVRYALNDLERGR